MSSGLIQCWLTARNLGVIILGCIYQSSTCHQRLQSLTLVILRYRKLQELAHSSFQCLVEKPSCCVNGSRIHGVRRLERGEKQSLTRCSLHNIDGFRKNQPDAFQGPSLAYDDAQIKQPQDQSHIDSISRLQQHSI